MRQFIRHPTDIPLEYKLEEVAAHSSDFLNDISHGGLSFKSSIYIQPDSVIEIRIPIHKPVFQAEGIVAWCRENKTYDDHSYDVGVKFTDLTIEYTLRMVEQVCHIEQYKKDVYEQEGRSLTGKQAAIEWISKYAKDFPG